MDSRYRIAYSNHLIYCFFQVPKIDKILTYEGHGTVIQGSDKLGTFTGYQYDYYANMTLIELQIRNYGDALVFSQVNLKLNLLLNNLLLFLTNVLLR